MCSPLPSYYPLFPPAQGVNFDMSHIDQTTMPVVPDVLILPSKLKYFVKVDDNVLLLS